VQNWHYRKINSANLVQAWCKSNTIWVFRVPTHNPCTAGTRENLGTDSPYALFQNEEFFDRFSLWFTK